MCGSIDTASLPFAVPAHGYLRGPVGNLVHVGKDADVACLTVPNRLPADGPAIITQGPSGLAVERLFPGGDTLGEARRQVASTGLPVATGVVTHVGREGDIPVVLVKVDRVVRPLPNIEAVYSGDLPPMEGPLGRLVSVAKASPLNPLNPRDFDRMVASLSKLVGNKAHAIETDAIDGWLKSLDFAWDGATPAELAAASHSLNLAMRKVPGKAWVGIKGELEVWAQRTGSAARAAEIKRHKLKVAASMDAKDRVAIDRVVGANQHYIRDFYGNISAPLSQSMQNIVQMGLDSGLSDFEIADMLKTRLGHKLGAVSRSYYNVVSSAVVARSRSYSQLSTYSDAGYEKYQLEAILDEVTTNFCRFIDGKELTVAKGLGRYTAADARPPGDAKYEMPWVTERVIRQGNDEGKLGMYIPTRSGMKLVGVVEQSAYGEPDKIGRFSRGMTPEQMENSNIGPPPYHARCRTVMLPLV